MTGAGRQERRARFAAAIEGDWRSQPYQAFSVCCGCDTAGCGIVTMFSSTESLDRCKRAWYAA